VSAREALTRVFVYGTLLPGERNAGVAAQGAFQAVPARLTGFRLLHLWPEDYPGIVPAGPGEQVLGAVLTYAREDWPRVLPVLDALEGVAETPPLYRREVVTVTLEGGEAQGAWTYIYAETERLGRPGVLALPEGDWRTHPRRTLPLPGQR
jgi:gamma-glutamylcyclotransferase (GGCT)/AIG2-like uncharacterized protein YtfP